MTNDIHQLKGWPADCHVAWMLFIQLGKAVDVFSFRFFTYGGLWLPRVDHIISHTLQGHTSQHALFVVAEVSAGVDHAVGVPRLVVLSLFLKICMCSKHEQSAQTHMSTTKQK